MDSTLNVFDIQRFSVHDGPGIRTTVFLKGCPLHCAWCQNPESQNMHPQMMIYPALCIKCGVCKQICPEKSPESLFDSDSCMLQSEKAMFIPDNCRLCGSCVDACPTAARRLAGQVMAQEKVLEAILRDSAFYGDTGGVTFSGGEPLAQWDALRSLLLRLREMHINVAIDTAGIAPHDVLHEVPDFVDLVLVDLKLYTKELHVQWTGVSNTQLLGTIRAWNRGMGGRLWISIPLIPGVQDKSELTKMVNYVSTLHPPPLVRLIPYHQLGNSKYEALGLAVPKFPKISDNLIEYARDLFADKHIKVMEFND